MDGEVWHLVEGRRDDGAPAIFRIRELAPRLELPRIFVVEMPYPITEMSRLPNAAAYRRLATFEEQWLIPACAVTGYELVGLKIEEGSFFLYMYGAADPNEVISRLAPFDAALGFYDDQDPSWGEYATLKDLLDQAKAMPLDTTLPVGEPAAPRNRESTIGPATQAAVRAAAKAAVAKPASAKAATAKSAAKPASAKRTTKLKKSAGPRSANASAAGKSKKPAAKKSAAKASAAKASPAKAARSKKPRATHAHAKKPTATPAHAKKPTKRR